MTAHAIATVNALAGLAGTVALVLFGRWCERHGRAACAWFVPFGEDIAAAERGLPDLKATYRPERDCA